MAYYVNVFPSEEDDSRCVFGPYNCRGEKKGVRTVCRSGRVAERLAVFWNEEDARIYADSERRVREYSRLDKRSLQFKAKDSIRCLIKHGLSIEEIEYFTFVSTAKLKKAAFPTERIENCSNISARECVRIEVAKELLKRTMKILSFLSSSSSKAERNPAVYGGDRRSLLEDLNLMKEESPSGE